MNTTITKVGAAIVAVLLLAGAAEARRLNQTQELTYDARTGNYNYVQAKPQRTVKRQRAAVEYRADEYDNNGRITTYVITEAEAKLVTRKPAAKRGRYVEQAVTLKQPSDINAGRCTNNRGSTSLARVVEPLASKAREIVSACGARIVSTDCRGGTTPNHRDGKAVDIAMPGKQSPACIYAHLESWPGGVSTDYWTAPRTRHVHFSYSRQHEWGLRFNHRRTIYAAVQRYKERHARQADAPGSDTFSAVERMKEKVVKAKARYKKHAKAKRVRLAHR